MNKEDITVMDRGDWIIGKVSFSGFPDSKWVFYYSMVLDDKLDDGYSFSVSVSMGSYEYKPVARFDVSLPVPGVYSFPRFFGQLRERILPEGMSSDDAEFSIVDAGQADAGLLCCREERGTEYYSPDAERVLLDEKGLNGFISTGLQLAEKDDISGTIIDAASGVMIDMEKLVQMMKDTDVVFAGETHDSRESHEMQLEIIKGIFSAGRNMAIGMEMFYRTEEVQKGLDDFINSRIDEDTFRKEVYGICWSDEWYHLYRDIFLFARDHGIRIIGLNCPKEMMSRFKTDPGSLDERERSWFAERVDYSDEQHRKISMWSFKSMSDMGMDVENMYPGQCIWDDTMSESIVRYLEENRGSMMVVCIGSLHAAYRITVPGRCIKLAEAAGMGFRYKTVHPHSAVDFEHAAFDELLLMDVADFIFYQSYSDDDEFAQEDVELDWMQGYRLLNEGKIEEAYAELEDNDSEIAEKMKERIKTFREARRLALEGDYEKARRTVDHLVDVYDKAKKYWMKCINETEEKGEWPS